MTTAEGLLQAGTFAHDALFYQGRDEYAREVCSFVRQGVSAGEPVLVAVPGRRLDLVRGALGEAGQAVSFADMAVLGRNPARIIPAIRRFTDSRRPHRTRFVGEPVWAGRSPAETAEATRHEALINEALAAVPASALCPYDASGLGPAVLADARRTHPRIVQDGARRPSADYSGTAVARAIGGQPLPSPPPGARSTAFGEQDLPALRDQVSRRAVQEGISPGRAQDLVIAVHEAAANTVVHAGGAGILRIWRDGLSLVCEIGDDGRITDPLAGRHPDSPHDDSGHGLRIAHELCDLVQLRSGPWGTTVRLHILAG
jgi:anti-sigma regulatory factor (Ser/Thr protein kinase)